MTAWWRDETDPRLDMLERAILHANLTAFDLTRVDYPADAFNTLDRHSPVNRIGRDDANKRLILNMRDHTIPFNGCTAWVDSHGVALAVAQSGRRRHGGDPRPYFTATLASTSAGGADMEAVLRLESKPRGTWVTSYVERMTGFGELRRRPAYRERIPDVFDEATVSRMLVDAGVKAVTLFDRLDA